MKGISVYLGRQNREEQKRYLEEMAAAGFGTVFTSLHIPEDSPARLKEELMVLGRQTQSLGMELVCDTAPRSLAALGLNVDTLPKLLQWGVTGLRLDYGFQAEQIAGLTESMKVMLNASTIDGEACMALKEAGTDLSRTEAWHNFYPRPETGLDRDWFIEKNALLRSMGIKTAAFIPGDGILRGPVTRGLPTLEEHRDSTPFTAFLDLQKNGFTDRVLIGDCSLSPASLRQFKEYQSGVMVLRCEFTADSPSLLKLALNRHVSRMDPSRDVLRSASSRSYAQADGLKAAPQGTALREIGAVTVDNEKYGRYEGELQITKRSLPEDEKVNVIGRVIEADRPLISFIEPGKPFRLVQYTADDTD